MQRRHFHALAGAALLAAVQLGLPGLARAQDGGTLRVWVGFPPGGSVDTVARIVAEKMKDTLKQNVIGTSTKAIADSQEVTILADRSVPFNVIKRVMSTCTSEGYARISLAVLQKAPDTQLSQN